MLRRLEIENYGLIARARVEFVEGATIFTGETGSGKTMLLGALGFVLGDRAGPDVVRRGAPKALVTLVFEPSPTLLARLDADGLGLDPGEQASIAREMSDAGRSNVRVNGRTSTAAYVREIGEDIVEIVGQHEARRLLSPAYHRDLLDRFGGDATLRARDAVARAHARAAELSAALTQLSGNELRARQRYDDACFALREIDDARIELDEDARLDERRRFLENVERIAATLRRAHDALAPDDGGAIGDLGQAGAALSGIAELSGELRAMSAQASALQSEATDLAAQVARALDETEFDPGELESINTRLDLLDRLKRKYGASLELVLEYGGQARTTVEEYEGRDRRTAELSAQVAAAASELGATALALTGLRKKAADALAKRVRAEFADIALSSARFEVAFEPQDRVGPDGAERLEFLFAANKGRAGALAGTYRFGRRAFARAPRVGCCAGRCARRRRRARLRRDRCGRRRCDRDCRPRAHRPPRARRPVICVTHPPQLATGRIAITCSTKPKATPKRRLPSRNPRHRRTRRRARRMLSGETHEAALNTPVPLPIPCRLKESAARPRNSGSSKFRKPAR